MGSFVYCVLVMVLVLPKYSAKGQIVCKDSEEYFSSLGRTSGNSGHCTNTANAQGQNKGNFSEGTSSPPSSTASYPCPLFPVDDFKCTAVGRFPDANDLSCQKYFLCSKLRNGTFIRTEYKCPNISVFVPLAQKCSTSSTCSCVTTTSSTSTTAAPTELSNPASATTSATSSLNSHTRPVTSSSSSSSAAVECSASSGEFNCTIVGRFPDRSDFTCRKYFLCSKLHNGTFLRTPYRCPNTSVFDPLLRKCSSSSICPCTTSTGSTTTSISVTSTFLPTYFSSIASETFSTIASTANPGNNSPSSVTTPGSSSLTAVQECVTSSGEFECTSVGRFPDRSDFSCREYLLCSRLRNGTFLKTEYRCPNTSIFNPLLQKCSTSSTCPCSIPGGTTTSTPISLTTALLTDFPSAESTTTSADNVTSAVTSSVTAGLTTLQECISSSHEFECTSTGRFPDRSDFTCRKYFLCSKLRNGTFLKTAYACPDSYFHPPSQQCSENYVCPCTVPSTVSSIRTTSYSSEFTATTLNTHQGNTTIPDSSPSSLLTTSNGNNTTSGCEVPSDDFTCTVVGRFPDRSDLTCRKYFLCSKLRNGTFIKTPYVCANSYFNPLAGKCYESYLCPCSNSEGSSTAPVSSSSAFSEGFTKAPELTTTASTTTSYTCTSPEKPYDFTCEAVGRFPDYSDNTCERYFLCSKLRKGTFIKTPYKCPPSSCIDSALEKCSSKCICPCR